MWCTTAKGVACLRRKGGGGGGGGGIGRQVAVMGWPCRDNISQDDIDQLKNAMTTHAENTKRDQPVLCKEP